MDFTRKTSNFQGWFWFKFDNLELCIVLSMALIFYSGVAKGLKLNKSHVRKNYRGNTSSAVDKQ